MTIRPLFTQYAHIFTCYAFNGVLTRAKSPKSIGLKDLETLPLHFYKQRGAELDEIILQYKTVARECVHALCSKFCALVNGMRNVDT